MSSTRDFHAPVSSYDGRAPAGGSEPTDEQVIAQAAALGIKWIPPMYGYKGHFDTVSMEQMRSLLGASESDGALLDGEGWTITLADGHSGIGYYAHCDEYPDEGAVFICAACAPAGGSADAMALAVAWKDLFWQVALAIKCLPSSFIDGNEHVLRKARELQALASAPASAPLPLTDETLRQLSRLIYRVESAGFRRGLERRAPSDNEPEIAELLAFIARETPAAGEPSGEYMGLPFAEARRRILEMPQDIAQGLAISLLIQNGTLNRALAAVSEPQAGQEVDVSDTRGKA